MNRQEYTIRKRVQEIDKDVPALYKEAVLESVLYEQGTHEALDFLLENNMISLNFLPFRKINIRSYILKVKHCDSSVEEYLEKIKMFENVLFDKYENGDGIFFYPYMDEKNGGEFNLFILGYIKEITLENIFNLLGETFGMESISRDLKFSIYVNNTL